MDVSPDRNRPTIATLLTAFLTSLLAWGMSFVPDTVPTEVTVSGYALGAALIALLAGKLLQGQLGLFTEKAPWSHDMHQATVAYAFTLDPESDEHDEAKATVLRNLLGDEYKKCLDDMGVPLEDA